MADLSEEQLDTLRHSIGVKNHPPTKPYRCHYCVAPNDEMATSLVAGGHMVGPFGLQKNSGLAFFYVTPAGAAAVGHELDSEDAEMVAGLMAKPKQQDHAHE